MPQELPSIDHADDVGIDSDRGGMNETLHECDACHFVASRVADTNKKESLPHFCGRLSYFDLHWFQ